MTDDQRRMAEKLGLHPTNYEGWPMPLIDGLLEVERCEGEEALMRELMKLTTPPDAR